MQSTDHKLLAHTLLKKLGTENNISMRCRLAFIYGNLEPDLNFLTYFHNALRSKRIKGHNFGNSLGSINKLVRKLRKYNEFSTLNSYRLGKLLHYTADCFTYAHNEEFRGNDREHIKYESDLHQKFKKVIASNITFKNIGWNCNYLSEVFCEGHKQYLSLREDAWDDIVYILWATTETMYSILNEFKVPENISFQGILCMD